LVDERVGCVDGKSRLSGFVCLNKSDTQTSSLSHPLFLSFFNSAHRLIMAEINIDSGSKNGVDIIVAGKTSSIDKVLYGSEGPVMNMFQGKSYPALPSGQNDVVYTLTSASGMLQSDTTEYHFKLQPHGSYITDVQMEYDVPPICNTLTNVKFNGTALTIDSGAVATIGTFITPSGTFTDGETVTGPGGFVGTVVGVEVGGEPTAVTIVDAGTGQTAVADYTLTGSTSGETCDSTTTIGDGLSTHPPTNGRIILPAPSGGSHQHTGSITDMGASATTNATKDNLGNSIICEAMTVAGVTITKAVTGITIAGGAETDMERFRTGGLASQDLAAHYCRHYPAYLTNSFSIGDATTDDWITVTSDDIVAYYEWFDRKRLAESVAFASTDKYDLKVQSARPNTSRCRIPLYFVHSYSQAFPIGAVRDSDIMVRIVTNGWEDVLVNSPTYNSNLTFSTNAAAVTVVTPAAATYTPAFGTYTLASGKYTNSQCCLLEKTSATAGTAPATAIANSMFQARLRVTYAQVPSAVQKSMQKGFRRKYVAVQFQQVVSPLFTSASSATVSEQVACKFPTPLMYAVNRLNHYTLQNDRMNYSCVRDPLGKMRTGKNANGAAGMSFFDKIRFKIGSESVIDFDAQQATQVAPSRNAVHTPVDGSEMYMLPFTAGNPFDLQKVDSAPMSSLDFKVVEFVKNPRIFTNYEFVGGLPAPASFSTSVRAMSYNIVTVSSEEGAVVEYLN
jgi:hypothetical protein